MKNQTHTKLIIASCLALAVWFPIQAQSAEPASGRMMDAKTMKCCQQMKEQHQKMMAEMKAQDVKLAEQVAKMNSAPEGKKVDLLAAVVTKMVEQRAAMNVQMEKMHDQKMQHMQSCKASMSQCPMTKGMKGMDEKSESNQKPQN